MQLLKILKILLQSNYFYFIFIILITIYVIVSCFFVEKVSCIDDNITSISGEIIDYTIDDDKIKFTIKISLKEKLIVNYYFSSANEIDKSFGIGDNIIFYGSVKEPNNNTIPNIFNYKKYLYNNDIFYIFIAEHYELHSVNDNLFNFAKNKFNNYLELMNNKDYLSLFVFGNKHYLDDGMYTVYKDNGIAHLLAISGLHISIFIKILQKFFSKINVKLSVVLIVLYLFTYMYLVGFLVSVLRCFLYYLLSNLFNLFDFKISKLKILSLCLFIVLLINPFYIFDIGFLYSFVISFALLLAFNKKKDNSYIKSLFKVTIVSFFASFPITVNINYEINIFSIVNNLVMVPFVSVFFYPVLLIVFIFPVFTFVLEFLIFIFELFNNFVNDYFSFVIVIPKFSLLFILLYYFFLLLALLNNLKYFFGVLALIIVLKYSVYFQKSYSVYFLDVGQGDATLLISPMKQEVILIDTGGSLFYDVSENYIKFLKSLGISHIDMLILTHGDFDHVGNAVSLITNFNIKNVMFNNNILNDNEMEIVDYNINRVHDNISLKYFKSFNLNDYVNSDENDSSLVFYFELYNLNFLFAGDVTNNEMEEIINKYNFEVDVLKVSHHGSKNNTNEYIIDAINPYFAIISSGINNLYGHPNDEVIKILNKFNVNICRTDINGTVFFEIFREKYNIFTYSP